MCAFKRGVAVNLRKGVSEGAEAIEQDEESYE